MPEDATPFEPLPMVNMEVGTVVAGGRALAHHKGATWLVAGALPGERVVAVATGSRAGVVEARTAKVMGSHHAARCADPCPHASTCGGCDWPHVLPDAGAQLKAAVAAEAARLRPELADRLREAPVQPSPLSYRLRARLHWDPATARLGFFEPRSWSVTSIPECSIVSPKLKAALETLQEALAGRCPDPADVEWLEDDTGETAVAALRPGRTGPDHILPAWVPTEAEVGQVLAGFHALSKSGRPTPVWGTDRVVMQLPIPLQVPIGCFVQVNRHLLGWLFERVASWIGSDPLPTWDLYGGVGFLAAAALHAGNRELRVVEPHRPAAWAAQANLPTARVSVGRTAEAYLGRQRELPSKALVLTDPPRAGMSSDLRHKLVAWHPDRILMLACDPATWARDAAFLEDRGYRLETVELVDLFPSTHHVEILAQLESE